MSSVDDNVDINLSEHEKNIVLSNLDKDFKLPCLKAFKVAKQINKKTEMMSAIAKSMNIKITDCELGVFGNLEFQEKNNMVYNNLKKRYESNKIGCKSLWNEARNSSLRVVGSTIKNSEIEVVFCQLGCFREKKGLKNGNKS